MPQGGQAYELSRSGDVGERLAKINAEIEVEVMDDDGCFHHV